ncbi:MAG: thrombospondin type 3 repeat-containing protein [Gammaproteobacteria bacterium]|nr:thrombospondin type 3 repeat-containing protein [Gammaproteobacteria bacterium]
MSSGIEIPARGCAWRAGLTGLVLAGALSHVAFGQGVPEARSDTQRDAAGQVVRTSAGKRVTLDQAMSDKARQAMATATAGASRFQAATLAAEADEDYSLSLTQIWQMSVWGTSIGRSGLIPADLDRDGKLEVVAGASLQGGFGGNNAWHVLKHNAETGEYDIVFTAPAASAGVSRITVLSLGGRPKVLVGTGTGQLRIYDGATLAVENELAVAGGAVTAIFLADADNDGATELVVGSASATHLLDPESYQQESQIPFGAADIAAGNVDADAAIELVYVSGEVVEFNGTVPVTEWDFGTYAAGNQLGLSDLDGDGMEEIVSARSWYYIDIYDADQQSPKGQINTDLDIHAIQLVDVNGDGRDEILYGDAQWGRVHAIDAATLQELWYIQNPEHGSTRIAVGDTDDDGALEIMWGAGWTSTGPDYLYVHDVGTRAREFESMDIVGPFVAVARGDADDDGVPEIVALSWESDSGYADGVLHIFDGETFELEWRSATNLFEGFAWTGIHDVAIGDVDGDGTTEIVVGTDRLYDGTIYVINGRTHEVERKFLYDDGSPIQALAIADYDRDGVNDIVAGGGVAHTGSPGTYVYVVDGINGAVKWQSVSLASGFANVFAIDTLPRGENAPDIVASMGSLFVVDGVTKALRKSIETDYRGFAVGDMNGDGRSEIWAGTSDGRLFTVDMQTMLRTETAKVCETAVNSVKFGTASTLAGSIQFACANQLGIYGIFEDRVLWRSAVFESGSTYSNDARIASANNLVVADRGERALLLAGTGHGVVAFQGYGTSNTDIDDDGILNHLDNCPETVNPGQQDADGDGVGNACNDAADTDGDEWADALDNCALLSNPDQADRDADRIGDGCDPYPDNPDNYAARCEEAIGNVSTLGVALAACEAVPKAVDTDGDGEVDQTDSCPATLPGQAVDSAGCSQAQFCEQFSGTGVSAMMACRRSDWRNDEPLEMFPGDCTSRMQRAGVSAIPFSCIVPQP